MEKGHSRALPHQGQGGFCFPAVLSRALRILGMQPRPVERRAGVARGHQPPWGGGGSATSAGDFISRKYFPAKNHFKATELDDLS